jgi:hypothetical protein
MTGLLRSKSSQCGYRNRWMRSSQLMRRPAMALWPTTLRIGGDDLKLLVTCPEGHELLKARLPIRPRFSARQDLPSSACENRPGRGIRIGNEIARMMRAEWDSRDGAWTRCRPGRLKVDRGGEGWGAAGSVRREGRRSALFDMGGAAREPGRSSRATGQVRRGAGGARWRSAT